MKKCFTLIELLIVIGIVAILSVATMSVILPKYEQAKEEIYNGNMVYVYENDILIYAGNEPDLSNYEIIDVERK